MNMRKDTIIGLSVLALGSICLSAIGLTKNFAIAKADPVQPHSLTLDGSNRPTELGTGGGVNKTISYGDYVNVKYTNAKINQSHTEYHCRLFDGGMLEKDEESYGIGNFRVTYGGHDSSGSLIGRFYESKGDVDYFELPLNSGETYDMGGFFNYFKVINEGGSTNLNLYYDYSCSERGRIPTVTSISATLKTGIVYYAGGRLPRPDDFYVTALYAGSAQNALVSSALVTVSVPNDFSTNGGDITVSYFGASTTVSYDTLYQVGTTNRYECEDSTIAGASGVVQLLDAQNFNKNDPVADTDYRAVGVTQNGYQKAMAAAFLGYDNNELTSSGSTGTYGGLVYYFNKNKSASMTFTINSDSDKYAVLTVRGASNGEGPNSKINDRLIRDIVDIKVNNYSVSNNISRSLKLQRWDWSTADQTAYDRNYSAGGLNLHNRFRYIHWTTLTLCTVYLHKGDNSIVMTSLSNESGNWDYIELTDLTNGSDYGFMKFECEDMTLSGCHKVVQKNLVPDWTQFKSSDVSDPCGNWELHAKAYLGYQGTRYACSGNPGNYGGFVHYFDTSGRTMTLTFESEVETTKQLFICGATNKGANTSTYTISDLAVKDAATISVNGSNISVDSDAIFHGTSNGYDASANRTGTVGASSLNGRYIYLLWEEVYVADIDIQVGTNTIVFTSKGSANGHWDYIRLV